MVRGIVRRRRLSISLRYVPRKMQDYNTREKAGTCCLVLGFVHSSRMEMCEIATLAGSLSGERHTSVALISESAGRETDMYCSKSKCKMSQ